MPDKCLILPLVQLAPDNCLTIHILPLVQLAEMFTMA